jgi:AAA ATPase domain
MDVTGDRAKQISSIQQALGDIQFATSSAPAAAPRYSADYQRAALLSSFNDAELDLRTEPVRQILVDCAVVVADNAVRYVLDTDVRRRVLRQLGNREQMQQTLRTVRHLPTDLLQDAINRIVAGEGLVDDDSSITWLQTAYRTLSWFAGIIDTEAPNEVLARIEAAGLRERFERLIGDNFRGRSAELRRLSDYVGVLTSEKGWMGRTVERWTSFEQKPALVVTGPGGIGKSTLLAKFILDHAVLPGDRRLPYACINFDSPTVRADDSKTILIEALGQLAIQLPDFSATIGAQRARWEEALLKLSGLVDSVRLARDNELTRVFRDEFVRLMTSIGIDRRPLLLVFDTFEIVQERQRENISAFYRFLRDLQYEYPALRVVISGRAGLADAPDPASDAEHDEIRTEELRLTGLDRATSVEYLNHVGLAPDQAEQVALYLIPDEAIDDGASPLSLRVAAEVWRRDAERSVLDTAFWGQLRAGRIQAQLITRYVRHTDPNSTAGQLAAPSLLLRRITADALTHVVAPAWGLLLEPGRSDDVLAELGVLVSLVIERAGSGLEPRPEVQRQVVELLSDLQATRVDRLHALSVTYYGRLSEQPDLPDADRDEARFDEIVHRLARGEDEQTVRQRWRPGCGRFVTGRVPLLTAEAQAVVEQLAGLELAPEMRARSSMYAWEIDATRRARKALESGSPEAVVGIAQERAFRDPAGELSLLLAQAHLARHKPVDAFDVATAAIRATEPGASSGLVGDLYQVAAEAACEQDQPQDALDYVEDALVIAREREDVPRVVAGLILQAVVQRERDQRAAQAAVEELQRYLPRLEVRLDERHLKQLIELAGSVPALVPATVQCGGLAFLNSKSRRQVARVITLVDDQVSRSYGASTGVLGISAGLSVGPSVTRTWQDALELPPDYASSPVLEALRVDTPASAELVEVLGGAFAAVALGNQQADSTTVTRVRVRLNPRRRQDLVEGLIAEFRPHELEQILADEFDRSLSSLTTLEPGYEHAVTTLVDNADEEWIGALLIAARNRRPDAFRLMQVANELDLSTAHYSANRLLTAAGAHDIAAVVGRLGLVEGQIGRLENGAELVGTGLLVSPNLLLLAESARRRLAPVAGGPPSQVRFGLKADAKGRRFDDGIPFPLPADSVIDVIPYGGGAGFALMPVPGYPADEPLGRGPGQRDHARRGFTDISRSADMVAGRGTLICWQQAARLELHVERRALSRDGDVFTVPGLGDSSEGSPCFTRSMDFLGLVLENRAGVARIVPGVALWQSLLDHGHGDSVGVALA